MKQTSLASKILEFLNAGWAILDRELRIEEYNTRFQDLLATSTLYNRPIYEPLPETIGLESVFGDLLNGKSTSFAIPRIAKESNDILRYFTLLLMSRKNPEQPFLIILLDETDQVKMLQQNQQHSFEMKLMRSLFNEKQATVTAGLIGISTPMQILKNTIQKVAVISTSSILIQGETGTGKGLVARMIHHATDETDRPFIEFNCAAVPESLLESELFGHEKGAFTHALTQKKGLLEEANGGTLFLDEIGDIHLNLQAKLLTVLDSRKFRRLGSTKEMAAQFRLIAATHRDLKTMVQEGSFREDLYYRIQVINLNCPPLRDLREDIILIADHFIEVYAREFGKSVTGLTSAAKRKLQDYTWPGNVRELRNVIERAMIFTENPALDSADIQLQGSDPYTPEKIGPALINEGLSFEELEKLLLKQALDRANGNQSRAARLLQMSRDMFRYRLQKYELI
jgi:transcriptional regulator with PAS, ATPase and Fis domain